MAAENENPIGLTPKLGKGQLANQHRQADGAGLIPARRRIVWAAFFMACASWLVLTPVWVYCSPGGLADRVIGALFSPPYRAGKHVAHLIFRDSSLRNATAYYIAPFLGAIGEVLFLMGLWVIGMGLVRWIRGKE
jgi:hypothetical protein